MKIVVDAKENTRLTLEQAFQFETGTLFKVYHPSYSESLGVSIRAKDNVNNRPMMVQLYLDNGNALVFSEDPRYPFTFEVLAKDGSVTLIQK